MSTILITGASSGIGKATAEAFADHGWNVVATMRNVEAGGDLARREDVLVTPLDVHRPETIHEAVQRGIQRFGAIDVLLNNAGFGLFGTFEELYETRGREIFETNVFGVMAVTAAVLPHFRAQRAGIVATVSSAAGRMGFPLGTLYDATKFAVEGFSEALAYELGPLGIGVKLIEPGLVRTRMVETIRSDVPPERVIDDYAAFSSQTLGLFNVLMAGSVPEASTVAERIFQAVTDGSDRLRYIVTDEAAEMIATRESVGEEAHMAQLRALVTPSS